MDSAVMTRLSPGPEMYRRVDLQARILGADAHGLVSILLEETAGAIAQMIAAGRASELRAHTVARERALLALHGLESGLDRSAAPDLADTLATIYRGVRKTLLDHRSGSGEESLRQAADAISALQESWAAIATRK